MAAAESNETRCTDVSSGKIAKCGEPTVIPRRQNEQYEFHVTDLLYYGLSVSFFFADVATDSIVFVEYLLQGHLAWGCFAMGFTILPACVTQLFSLRWHRSDGSLKTIHWLLHFLFLGFLHRYLNLLYIAMHSLRNKQSFTKDRNWVYRQESDICMLHLFESFMGAVPQLILQLYIIVMLHHAPLWTSVSAITSFCSLTWALSMYMRAMHNINRERNNVTWVAFVLQALWRSGMLLSRISVLVLTAVLLKTWFFLFFGLHWLFMTIWVILQNTEFCPTVWEERIYNCIIGLIYCFDFFNLREGKSRDRVLIFYLIILTQNLVFLTLYASYFKNTTKTYMMIVIALVIIGGMLVGLASMLLYYTRFHPSRTPTVHYDNNEQLHSETAKADNPKSFKMLYRGSLTSLHHAIDISPRTISEDVATDKQFLLTNIAQMSDCAEEGIVNRNYNTENDSNTAICVSAECERSHSRMHKEEIASQNENSGNMLFESVVEFRPLCQGLPDIDDMENHQRQKRRGIYLPIIHGLDIEKNILSEGADTCLLSQKRHCIYEHDIASQLEWHASDISNVNLNLDNSEQDNSPSFDACNKVISALDIIKNRGRLTTPPQLEAGRIFDIDKVSKDVQQRDETMSCVTSIHDYENVCPLGIARPPWCIRSWKGYTDIETYIHDDSVVRDRRRDTLTSTTGTTYSSEFSDGMYTASFMRGILKQDDYMDTLIYDLAESKDKSAYGDMLLTSSNIDDQNATLYMAKPVVIDDKGGMFALDTITEEHDDSASSDEKFQRVESIRDSASTLVSTIDQIRKYTAENSPRHIYHTTGTQWEDLYPKNFMAHARFAKVLFDNDLKNTTSMFNQNDLTIRKNLSPPVTGKCEIDAIREFVKCCAMESIKKTPLIDAILSDSPVLGNREKFVRQVTFADTKDDFDAKENDLYIEMSPLVSVENGENSCARLSDLKVPEVETYVKRNLPVILKKSPQSSDKENLAPSKTKRINSNDSNDRRASSVENDDKSDKSLCNVRFNLKERKHIFLEQVLSPPKLWNRRISFHPSTKNL